MNSLKRIFYFVSCFSSIALHAQTFRFSNYTPLQGLSNSSARCILKDSRGFLWIGTADGLNQFDGHSFKIFRHNRNDSLSLPGNFINSIAEDSAGSIWIGTNDGIARMNPLNGSCEIFQHRNEDSSSLTNNYDARVFIDRENKIWICNGEEITQLTPNSHSIKKFLSNKNFAGPFNSFCEENSNSYWFGCNDGLIHFIPSENLWNVYKLISNPHRVTTVNCIFMDHRNTVWCGTWSEGLCRFDRESKSLISLRWDLSPVNPSVVNIVTSILETEDAQHHHKLLVGTGQGLLVVKNDSLLSSLTNIPFIAHDPTKAESIAGNFITQIIEDNQHIIWLTEDGGMSCIIPAQQIFQTLENGIHGTVTEILPAGDEYFITCWYGDAVTVCDKNWQVKKTLYRIPPSSPSLDNGQVSSVIRDANGNFWFATFNGLVKSNASLTRFETFQHDSTDSNSISSSRVTCLAEDNQHRIWVGTYNGGLNLLDSTSHHFRHFFNDNKNENSIPSNLIWMFHHDRFGNIWIGTNGGLCRYDEKKDGFINYSDGIEGTTIRDICENDSGILWIATEKGLNMLNPFNGKTKVYSSEEGLASYGVEGIINDDEGNLWLGTEAGISRFNPEKKFFTNYSVKNGLPDLAITSVFVKDDAGIIHCGARGNFLVFNPRELNQPLEAPPVYITQMKVGNTSLSANSLEANTTLKLHYNQNVISFTFTAPEFVDPEDVRYFIKLDGADNEWIDVGSRSSATYASLNPGSFTFHVKAMNADGMMSEKEAAIEFAIYPPYWKTWWFVTMLIAVVSLIFFFAVRYVTTRKLREQVLILEKEKAVEQERTRISRDMHDDLGSGLTKIAILSEVTQRQLNEREKAEHLLHSISDSARTLVDNLNEIIWTLNPHHDNLDSLMAYIRDYATSYFDAMEISVSFSYPTAIPSLHLTDQQRRNIFLVVKETLNNISKHAQPNLVNIGLKAATNSFQIIISDNGKGFDVASARAGGNGLKNMPQRMKEIGGRFELTSEPGKGATTVLSLNN